MNRLLKNILLLVVSLLVALVAVEGLLRATHIGGARLAWTQPDDLIGWRFTPGREYWFHRENDHAVTGRINRNGWRDRERTVKKPAGTRRIALLGDSFVEAFQVEYDSTFGAILERTFNRESGRPVEVLNFGRSGMTQTEESLILEREVVDYDPDVVVLVFVPQNDIADMSRATTTNPLRPFYRARADGRLELDTSFTSDPGYIGRKRINAFKQRSALVSLLAERYNAFRRAGLAESPAGDGGLPRYLTMCTSTPDSTFARNYAISRALIRRMTGVCAARGIPLVLVAGHVAYRPGKLVDLAAMEPSFDPAWFDRDLAGLCREVGAEPLGLQAIFAAEFARTGRPLTWVHWNYEGHRVVARALASLLAE